jgi:hypothetical protein
MNIQLNDRLKGLIVLIFLNACYHKVFAQSPRSIPLAYSNSSGVNFIRTWEASAPEQDANAIMARPLKDVRQTTQYLDGLGRPLQIVVKEGALETGSFGVDLVSPVEYDEFGREVFKYLPFAANNAGNNTHLADGTFKLNPFEQQAAFYNSSNSSSPIAGQGETFFYSKINFESSPLNRINNSYAVGNSWVGSEANSEPLRRNVQSKYYVNTQIDGVRIWDIAEIYPVGQFESYSSTSVYPTGELYKSITIDERKNQVIEFNDKQGKVILKKVQLTALADDGSGSNHTGWLCTYYIYDDFGKLRCVIQPEAVKKMANAPNAPDWTLTASLLNEQCFRYEYDQRNNMIIKKNPGFGEVYMVYDDRERLIMTQDANMRQGIVKWMVTKYDEINRPIETGLWTNSTPFNTHLVSAYSSINYPVTSTGYEQLSGIHYDDYIGIPNGLSSTFINTWNSNFSTTSNTQWPYPQMPTQNTVIKGLPTWTQVKVLGTTNSYLYSATIYDDKSKPIQVQSTNITGGTDVTTTQYSWAGQPLVNVIKHEKANSPTQTLVIVTQISYDALGRILKTEKKIK